MTHPYLFHAGEATVFAKDGQFTDAMPEILIGATDGPVGQAFANRRAQSMDKQAVYRTNDAATKLAIQRALNREPSVDDNRHRIKHDMDDGS